MKSKKIVSRSNPVLVTGAAGFIGSNLVKRLLAKGWQVSIITRPNSNLTYLQDFINELNIYQHDGTTAGLLAIIKKARPKLVFHLASKFLAQHQPEDIEALVQSNVLFSTQLVEAMLACGVNYLINTGTSWQHYKNLRYNPVCLYAAMKQAFENILTYYIETSPLKVITLKLFDVYGPGDKRPKLFNLLRKAALSKHVLDLSPGEQFIDAVFIDDIVEAYLLAARRIISPKSRKVESFSVSSQQPIKLKHLVKLFSSLSGKKLAVNLGARPYREREVMATWNRGKNLPNWQPKVGLKEGVLRLFSEKMATV